MDASDSPKPKHLFDLLAAKINGETVAPGIVSIFSREQDLLRSAIAYPMAFAESPLRPACFEAPWHRHLWTAIMAQQAFKRPGPLDIETLASELRVVDPVAFAGFLAGQWLTRIMKAGSAVLLEHAIQVLMPEILERAQMRLWRGRFQPLLDRVGTDPKTLVLYEEMITEAGSIASACDYGKTGTSVRDLVRDRASRRRDIVPTGFSQIDKYTGGGLGRGEMMVVGGGTNSGKSMWCQRLLRQVAGQGRKALYISIEDPDELMMCRILADYSCDAGTPLSPKDIRVSINTGHGADPAIVNAATMAEAEQGDKVIVYHAPSAKISDVCAVMRRHRSLYGIDLVVVDYLQAIQSDEPTPNATQAISSHVATLKRTAMESEMALVLITQYNRESYKNGEEPGLNSAKGSGDIENASEVLLLLWRTGEVGEEWVLHAKVAKLKWSKRPEMRYIIATHDVTGSLLDWIDDDDPPMPAKKPGGFGKKGGR